MGTDQAIESVLLQLERWEGRVPFLYLDSAAVPNVTIGVGCLVPNVEAAVALPFRASNGTDGPATQAQIAADFARVRTMAGGQHASEYRGDDPYVYLADADITALGARRLNEMLPRLATLFDDFDGLPEPCQEVLIDLGWNLGLNAPKGLAGWCNLRRSVNAHDWQAAALQTHCSTSRPSRNEWRAARMVQAGSV